MTRLFRAAFGGAALALWFGLCANVSSAAMVVRSYSAARHDRFYVAEEGDPAKAFIGNAYDWSGVGRVVGGEGWATMISPTYFLSAAHYYPGKNSTLRFYEADDPNGPFEDAVVAGGVRIGQTDIWLGRLDAPVSDAIAQYPILMLPNDSNYNNLPILTFGRSNTLATETNVRLGRNHIDPNSYQTATQEPSTGEAFIYDFDLTGGAGGDETHLRLGDSGAPTFVVHNGVPSLVGIHWFIDEDPVRDYSGDTFLRTYFDRINSAMSGQKATLVSSVSRLTWDEQGDGRWNSSTHWSGYLDGTIPDGRVDTVIDTNTVSLSGDGVASSIQLDDDATLRCEAGSRLNVGKSLELFDATLDLSTDASVSVGELTLFFRSQLLQEVAPGIENAIRVSDQAELKWGAGLELDVVEPFESVGIASHRVLRASTGASIEGVFTYLPKKGDYLGHGVFMDSVRYGDQSIDALLLQAAAGDTNGDAKVDLIDIFTIKSSPRGFGTGATDATWLDGDVTGSAPDTPPNGVVNLMDIFQIKRDGYFGSGSYAAMPGLSEEFVGLAESDTWNVIDPSTPQEPLLIRTVPEPSTWLLLATGILVVLAWRRSRT